MEIIKVQDARLENRTGIGELINLIEGYLQLNNEVTLYFSLSREVFKPITVKLANEHKDYQMDGVVVATLLSEVSDLDMETIEQIAYLQNPNGYEITIKK